ncbi:post-transcriptional regulator [Paenibacillus alkalitolerans]|uniref:post-transcriptional regulator n=1 Tax=Paenibacillus alkalitolerans TaxID=2799335 RepID=UPI002D7FE05F|nr:post-transcriptional regulator [Paenibacillus alkalitolerans]
MTERDQRLGREDIAEEREDVQGMSDNELNAMIETICMSKAEEFHMLGYGSVTGKDIWDCVSSKYKETPPLHRVVNDILSLKTTQLMNWMTLSAWKMS